MIDRGKKFILINMYCIYFLQRKKPLIFVFKIELKYFKNTCHFKPYFNKYYIDGLFFYILFFVSHNYSTAAKKFTIFSDMWKWYNCALFLSDMFMEEYNKLYFWGVFFVFKIYVIEHI